MLALAWAEPRANAWKVAAVCAGVALGMLPEKLFLPAQGYPLQICLADAKHALDNGWIALSQAAVHVGRCP